MYSAKKHKKDFRNRQNTEFNLFTPNIYQIRQFNKSYMTLFPLKLVGLGFHNIALSFYVGLYLEK